MCKNPSFQHLWAEVTFLSPFELLQAFSPFPLILRSKINPPTDKSLQIPADNNPS